MEPSVLGIDLGGTNVHAGIVRGTDLVNDQTESIPSQGAQKDVLEKIYEVIDRTIVSHTIEGIGIGVPSVVDVEQGIVYDVQNIPSWEEVPIKDLLEEQYGVPVYVNNDANCFALGERYYGKAQGFRSVVGLIIGTGLGAGVIIHGKLYNGRNCGAGEFGMIQYLDSIYEHYVSGQFFQRETGENGEILSQRAEKGDEDALELFAEFGYHLANAIQTILYSLDPEIIVFGGSVRNSYDHFTSSMWEGLQSFGYPKTLENLTIEVSENENIPLLGAAALCLDAMR